MSIKSFGNIYKEIKAPICQIIPASLVYVYETRKAWNRWFWKKKKTLVLKEKKEMSILRKFLMDTLEQYVDIYMFCLGRRNMVDAVYSSDYEKPH